MCLSFTLIIHLTKAVLNSVTEIHASFVLSRDLFCIPQQFTQRKTRLWSLSYLHLSPRNLTEWIIC